MSLRFTQIFGERLKQAIVVLIEWVLLDRDEIEIRKGFSELVITVIVDILLEQIFLNCFQTRDNLFKVLLLLKR